MAEYPQNEEILAAIRYVAEQNKKLFDEVRALRAELRTLAAAPASPAAAIAPDSDLDGQYGDPGVKKDPKRWTGAPLAPCKMSDAPPEWLDVYAEFKDWQAGKEEEAGDAKKAGYMRRDAARARGWAARKRAGWKKAGTEEAAGETASDEI